MAEAQCNTQLASGHDDEFLYAVEDDFICLICHLPLKEPVLTRCGHRFCDACLEEYFLRQEDQNQPYTCPADREDLDRDKDLFPDKATGRKILSLVINCQSVGCSWTGELRSKKVHLETCNFKLISCTNENCQMNIERKALEQHLRNACEWRIMECEYCKQLHPKKNLQGHFEFCSKFPVPCPNSCDESITREMIPNHIKDHCPLTPVSCPYAQMGCIEKVERKNLDLHLQKALQEHLNFACDKLNSTQVQLGETRVQLKETQTELKLTRDQVRETQDITRNLVGKLNMLQRHFGLKSSTDKEGGNTRYIWKIDKFSDILRQANAGEKETIESDPFFSECYGYKLKVSVIPHFAGYFTHLPSRRSPHLSVAIFLMKSEYDNMLPWPFRKKITFTLIDQHEDLKQRNNVVHYLSSKRRGPFSNLFLKRPGEGNLCKGGIPLFISHKVLQTRRYIVNDTVFLQVDVEPDE